jgi:hypothetical protein
MPDGRDTKLLQVLSRQIREDRLINVVLAECPLVSFEAKVPQPSAEVHDNVQVPSRAYVGVVFGRREVCRGREAQKVYGRMIATPRLMHIVNAAFVEDIKSRATVHDSFGFLAAQAWRFRQIILQPFIKMYEQHDVLADDGARREIRGVAKDPDTPKRRGAFFCQRAAAKQKSAC